MAKTTDELVREVADRVRRMETRQAAFLESQGFSTNTGKPQFYESAHEVTLPSPRVSIRDILAVIPEHVTAPVGVYVGQDCLCVVQRVTTMPKSRT